LAPLWRRAVASTITGAGATGEILTLAGTLVGAFVAVGETNEKVLDVLNRKLPSPKDRREPAKPKRWIEPGPMAAQLVIDVHQRNWQTNGRRWMHVRRVDVADGGPVRVRSAIVRSLVSWLVSRSISRGIEIDLKRRDGAWDRIKPEFVQIVRDHPDDWRRAARKILRLANENRANPFTPLLFIPAAQLVIHLISITLLSKRQGIADLLGGTVLVMEDPSDPPARS
jgi:uncharacterized RDD family membrane protein YckC